MPRHQLPHSLRSFPVITVRDQGQKRVKVGKWLVTVNLSRFDQRVDADAGMYTGRRPGKYPFFSANREGADAVLGRKFSYKDFRPYPQL